MLPLQPTSALADMTLSHLISGARTCTWQTELPSLSSPLCFTVIEPSAVSLPFAFAEEQV